MVVRRHRPLAKVRGRLADGELVGAEQVGDVQREQDAFCLAAWVVAVVGAFGRVLLAAGAAVEDDLGALTIRLNSERGGDVQYVGGCLLRS